MRCILLFILISSCNLFAQDLEFIKSTDTIYLYFDKLEKYDDLHLIKKQNEFIENYTYQFPDAKALYFEVSLQKPYNSKPITISKDFMDKNRNKIITIDILHKYNFVEIQSALYKPKRIFYIIDKSDFKRKKIILKKANYIFLPQIII
ncbi:hypothetical protein LZZ90_13975 [Flavobacterium sp. SM15]|uniref:hypothetical protein n=1 Tax=Flavobacterium sp. SM15 TaxID=2908005 RepID=UPI001EDADB2B|nr:hypothetical protein [Flavobacterium sp. SM15]MCG2612613.1 hypothetical protein [Flavobacterium sp. SM15]